MATWRHIYVNNKGDRTAGISLHIEHYHPARRKHQRPHQLRQGVSTLGSSTAPLRHQFSLREGHILCSHQAYQWGTSVPHHSWHICVACWRNSWPTHLCWDILSQTHVPTSEKGCETLGHLCISWDIFRTPHFSRSKHPTNLGLRATDKSEPCTITSPHNDTTPTHHGQEATKATVTARPKAMQQQEG